MFGPDDFEVQIQQENPPGIHAEPSIPPAQDEEYGDFIVKQASSQRLHRQQFFLRKLVRLNPVLVYQIRQKLQRSLKQRFRRLQNLRCLT